MKKTHHPVTKTWLEARQFLKDKKYEELEEALDMGIMLVAALGGKDKDLIEGVKRETWLERFWITTENYVWPRRSDYEKNWRMK